ncbi:hypothetical protein [Maritimibacter sp. UBA3975]|uniref:hypothetical protein n=1 Tax=Maritimibacter sp. UBA3975 TaxID=1946833 RepID=UPI000C0A1D57|nr:hypothetical protein [Maritimibacter sp. UBA3975]MAM62111.1 hypothetical protein [Maritimibacter sp.]|tara:strand:- start:16477 stop:17709 length:1233 start_codon:yes stop_codon:yes gene_type:complete
MAALLFISVGGVLTAFVTLMPWRWAWRLWVAGVLAAATYLFLLPPVPGVSRSGLTIVLALIFAGPATVVTAVRLLVRQMRGEAAETRLPAFDTVLLSGLAVLVAGIAFAEYAGVFAGSDQIALAHALPVVMAALVAGIAVFVPWRRVSWSLGAYAAALVALSVGSWVLHPRLVLASADRIAAEDHCISLPLRARGAMARADLTFLTMDKSGPAAGPHPMLVTPQGANHHWSFRLMRFAGTETDRPMLYCTPQGQSGLVNGESDAVFVDLNGTLFLVPRDFGPAPAPPETLGLSVTYPDFSAALDAMFPTAWFGAGLAPTVARAVTRPGATARTGPHGLIWLPKGGGEELLALREGGLTRTVIDCFGTTCNHRFRAGRSDRIILQYDRVHLPDWRDLETRAIDVFARFRVD